MLCKTLITIRLLSYLCCFHTVEGAAPSFLIPTSATAPRSVDENSVKDVSILNLEGADSDGDKLSFSIFSQTPTSPQFVLDASSGLLKTPTGLDAEFSLTYSFTFGVSDGSATIVYSDIFTLNINDINEFTPVFQGTTNSVSLLDYVSNGYTVYVATATDADATATVTYSLSSGNSPVTFSLDSINGLITVSDSSQLASTSSYSLIIQASDGTNTVTVTVSITVNEDICSPNPCAHSGTCSLTGNSYRCACASQYIGQNCTQANYCYPDPCVNGTCVNGDKAYTCSCSSGYYGQNCSKVDYCYPDDPCQNGTCVILDTEYLCNCTTGFLGQNCSQVNYCYPDPCVNGTCVNGDTAYTCSCSSGYYGQNCSKVDYCYPDDPCQNGTCVTLDTEYFCNCTTGFLGQNCSQVDTCSNNNNPCENGGTCVTSDTSYTCTCASGFTGTNCTSTTNYYCALKLPCKNGATCIYGVNPTYTCTCYNAYMGFNCETHQSGSAASVDEPKAGNADNGAGYPVGKR